MTSARSRRPWVRVRANCSASSPITSRTSDARSRSSGYASAPSLDDGRREVGDRLGREAELARLADRPAHDAAQDVVAALVAGAHPVGGQERHRAAVVGERAQGAVVAGVRAVGAARGALGPGDQRPEGVRVEEIEVAIRFESNFANRTLDGSLVAVVSSHYADGKRPICCENDT